MNATKKTPTHIYSSPINRVVETSKTFQEQLNKIWIETKLRIRNIFWYIKNEKYYPKEVLDEWIEKSKTSWKSENEFVKDFLDGKRETKPVMLAKNYLIDMERIFKRVIYKKSKFSIVSFRHWDKSIDWSLSKLGKEQAESLWNKIWKDIDEYKDTIFIATHNSINESIIRCLFTDGNLPNEWREPLDFTEDVKYTFYPEEERSEPYLEIEWRGIKKEIPYKRFKELVENLTK